MTEYADVPSEIVRRVRAACAHLPEAYEEQAFEGVRWRIRGSTLAHVIARDYGEGPVSHVTFHALSEELDALVATGDPFFPGWGAGLVAMVLRSDGTTDWDEVRELLTESYCLLAPKKLVARLDTFRPDV
ncbi:MAG TPA: MmcQ/YjbR family DNA-binding protein [Acidimicrobiales bacterium]|nr:MmcQ/YjbR family DNA-binding protein [Acidimicrobiales bacterium]